MVFIGLARDGGFQHPDLIRAGQAPASAQPQLTNASAVVVQYHQDITDHDWHAARALGGSNIAAQNGQTCDSWVSDLGRREHLGPPVRDSA